jgi:hypothetical protein
LDDSVVESLRTKFVDSGDKVRYSMDSREGDILLLKLIKGLKYYGWAVHTSHSFSPTGSSGSVESVFYYEKALVPNGVSRQQIGTAVPNASSNKSGVEESKSASIYASKPLPAAPKVSISEEVEDLSQRRVSANVSTNRDKLLQKYNQHRRASAKGLGAEANGTDGTTDSPRLSVSQLSKSFSGPLSSSVPPTPCAPAGSKATGSLSAPATALSSPAGNADVQSPEPSPTPQVSVDRHKSLGAASAYPSLVKRISSKGFMPVSSAVNAAGADKGSKGAADLGAASGANGISHNVSTAGFVTAATSPLTVQTSPRPPAGPNPASSPTSPLEYPPSLRASSPILSPPVPPPAPPAPPAPAVTSPVAAAPPVPAVVTQSGAPSGLLRVQAEPAEDGHDDPSFRGGANPMTSPYQPVKFHLTSDLATAHSEPIWMVYHRNAIAAEQVPEIATRTRQTGPTTTPSWDRRSSRARVCWRAVEVAVAGG